jgi:hypothetical protein
VSASPPPARGIYLDVSGVEPVFGQMHMPAEREQHETAVLLSPPFGSDEICSYRSRRAWAQQLAAAGHPTLRIDLPSAGDSGGSPNDSGRLDAWTAAVASAAGWLGASTGRTRVAAIGIGLGGMLICRAVAEGAPIAEAVLWAVPAKGRTFVRELRAFGRTESSRFSPGDDFKVQPLPRGYVAAGGFVLSTETARSLDKLDLAALDLPREGLGRVLLLERDGIAVDDLLLERFRQTGREVTVLPGPGYNAMMAEPQEAQAPTEVFASVEEWLQEPGDDGSIGIAPAQPEEGSRLVDEGPARGGRRPRTAVLRTGLARERDTAELTVGDAVIRERSLVIEQPFGRLFGVLTEPAVAETTDLGAVLLNAGAIRRVGPNRMWVELARRWAARGVPSLRLDLEGLGDSDGDDSRFADVAELYIPQLVDQVQTAIDSRAFARGRTGPSTARFATSAWSPHSWSIPACSSGTPHRRRSATCAAGSSSPLPGGWCRAGTSSARASAARFAGHLDRCCDGRRHASRRSGTATRWTWCWTGCATGASSWCSCSPRKSPSMRSSSARDGCRATSAGRTSRSS